MRVSYCPVCGDEVAENDTERFGMCLDCFAEELVQDVRERVVRDFLTEFGDELREYIRDNYF